MDDSNLVFETSQEVEVVTSFDQMGIRDDLLRGIYAYGLEKPSAIQQRAVLPIIEGRDVILQAQSGTGKTSMIALTVCQMVDTASREVQALILSPSRKLAAQTVKVILAIGNSINVHAHACLGGKNIDEDIRKLEFGVHVVSGTPGRVYDMFKQKTLRTSAIKLLILDESDQMLSRGFKDQIYDVYRYLSPELQVCLISATLPHEILEMTSKFMTDPLRILVKRDELTLEGFKQSFLAAPSTDIPSTDDLKDLIHSHALFFDHLVELIPARFYLPVDDKETPWFQGLSKAAKASAKKQSRENLKKARRERLDPEKSVTTLDLLKKSIEAGKSTASRSPDQREGEKATDGANHVLVDSEAVTYEELRNRLRRRIEELRASRNTRDPNKPKEEREDRSKGKRKSEGDVKEELKKQKICKKEKEKNASAVDLSFGHVKLGEMGEKGRSKRGLSKVKALEKAEKLKEAMQDPQKGEIVSKNHSWKAAVSRAAGVKVHDDPKLIRESMKKEKKRRQKNAEKWKERVETTQKLKAEKQKKRADNISEKIQQKKMKKIEKREKKLMRPGFEGRRESYINDS